MRRYTGVTDIKVTANSIKVAAIIWFKRLPDRETPFGQGSGVHPGDAQGTGQGRTPFSGEHIN